MRAIAIKAVDGKPGPIIKAWGEWLSSKKGQSCTRMATLYRSRNPERTLQERLESAFKAGVKAERNPK